jgi:hypothetical protein
MGEHGGGSRRRTRPRGSIETLRSGSLRVRVFATFCTDEDDLEARCMIAFAVAVGTHFIATDHRTRSRADVLSAVVRLLQA